MDGTGRLFKRFIAVAPTHVTLTAVEFPTEPLTYPELAARVAAKLPDKPVVFVAESFSGPLAIALAAQRPVSAVVFANSFVSAPRCRGLRRVIAPALFQISPPTVLLRRYMVGPAADDALVRELTETIDSSPSAAGA